jgi:hypothetical protein
VGVRASVHRRSVDDLDEIPGLDGLKRRLVCDSDAYAADARHHAQLADAHAQHDVGDQGAGDALRVHLGHGRVRHEARHVEGAGRCGAGLGQETHLLDRHLLAKDFQRGELVCDLPRSRLREGARPDTRCAAVRVLMISTAVVKRIE